MVQHHKHSHNPPPGAPGAWQTDNPGGTAVTLDPAPNLFHAAHRIEGALADALNAEAEALIDLDEVRAELVWTRCGIGHDGGEAILYAAFQKETGRVAGLALALKLIRGQS